MKIELDIENTVAHKIVSYSDNAFQLKNKFINLNLIISRTRLIENWYNDDVQNLATQHLAEVIAWQPEIILLGTGKQLIFPNPELLPKIVAKNIGFEVMDTGAACRSYNLLIDEGRDVVACLLLAAS